MPPTPKPRAASGAVHQSAMYATGEATAATKAKMLIGDRLLLFTRSG